MSVKIAALLTQSGRENVKTVVSGIPLLNKWRLPVASLLSQKAPKAVMS
jgi:hypothetical protein